jgi:hypothetical protein
MASVSKDEAAHASRRAFGAPQHEAERDRIGMGAIIKQIHAETMKALNSTEMKEKLAHDGAEPAPTTPEAFAAHIRNKLEKWRKVAKAAGIEPQ